MAIDTFSTAAASKSGPTGAGITLPVRFSHLRAYGKSAAHGLHARTATEEDETYAMERGTAVHAILFKTKRVTGYPGKVRRGKEYEQFVSDNTDAVILTNTEYIKAQRMAECVMRHKRAMELLQGESEDTLWFEWMQKRCRATPDVRGLRHLTELKTSATVDPGPFVWHALRMQYHAQMAFQMIGCRETAHDTIKDCYIVAIEASEPHPITILHLTEKSLQQGDKLCRLWMERLVNSEDSGEWPGYCEADIEMDTPDESELEYE